MGSSIAPKMFPARQGSFGQSAGDAVTQTQPLAQVANPGLAAISGYSQQGQTDPTQVDQSGGTGSAQDLLKQFRGNSGGTNRPFYGAMF